MTTLRQALNGKDFIIGAATSHLSLLDKGYCECLSTQFNALTPSTALKWDTVHTAPDKMDFSAADQLLEFAKQHGMKMRGQSQKLSNQVF